MSETIIRPDAKGRINLGEVSKDVSSYRMTVAGNGKITLEPYAEIPLSEKWIFEDRELLEKVLSQVKATKGE